MRVFVLLCALVASALSLQFGVVVFPETGHLNPLLAIVEAASKNGHTTVVFGPEFFMKSCEREVGSYPFAKCVNLGFYNISEFGDEYMQKIVQMDPLPSLEEINKHANAFNAFLAPALLAAIQRESIHLDLFLVDFGAWSGTAVADALKTPTIVVWPLTLQFPVINNPSIPALGTAMSLHMSWTERLYNYFVQHVFLIGMTFATEPVHNAIRASVGAAPVDKYDLYYRRIIITPSIYGLDIGQPLCPNVNAVGFLSRVSTESDLSNSNVPAEWKEFMDGCTNGIVYINMGSVAILPDEWVHRIESAAVHFVTEKKQCVVWKLQKRQLNIVTEARNTDPSLMRLTTHLPFSPRLLLAHPHASVFVTHCGDTSVYESVQNMVPLVGISLFADQADMCARVADARVGLSLDKRSPTLSNDLISAITEMQTDKRPVAMKKLKSLKALGHALGGARRAADILESVALHADLYQNFFCDFVQLPWYQLHDIDVTLASGVGLFVLFYVPYLLFRACCCRGSKRQQRDTKHKRE
ncbi:UDP-glucoronosyl and UDP-glucosyl transferase, putative [Bodo saltans]|uniref:UDP-glucoronosyl and UDP-glucosyl transferase, putative n=1 Tax=Bodo saltans TaxID=75058 RepID=A0A0S4KJI1_BODSA|nr:UDP-glucoronosyl and UDP-glucosyl transferase, putative [Bodo saltans]|eukprot:CUI14437.1 UDP-glucoronosyl and UDP-glucosyl transferase, putative [Bodo saltans]